eukprot:GDKJ01001809.1.p1 GENE.GDKJ01001809.1~~GDKJ01001809.1.p1  ORF type:complete len:112 (-),score=19.38 GDKJ01001809.1:170-505(-)
MRHRHLPERKVLSCTHQSLFCRLCALLKQPHKANVNMCLVIECKRKRREKQSTVGFFGKKIILFALSPFFLEVVRTSYALQPAISELLFLLFFFFNKDKVNNNLCESIYIR